jgi:L-cysteine:1D-myo-inositol 2-amino-2-deoxy-alpha-D-glucopyranoside ligase
MQTWASVDVPRLAGGGPPLSLYDSATGRVRPTAPGSTATMYVCGITPYDATHLGHAATYLAFDLVNRVWRDLGHDVHYVQNVTDIDDPLLERAARDQDDWVVLGMRETALFREDMAALRVVPPRHYVGAVEAMDEISELVGKLMAAGAAYRVDDPEFPDVYFDSSVTGHFGYESNYDEATMLALSAERGGDPDRPGKRHRLDPLLWRTAREGEPRWDGGGIDGAGGGDLGPGRPGWHVECAAIALNRLGPQIDLNGGGSDLAFPHHECGAAHAEAHTGVHPFARHYTHAGMIGLDGEKMSKSRGNLVFVSKLRAQGVDPNAVRLALLAGHYRTDRPWTGELLATAQGRLARWREATALDTAPAAAELVTRLRAHLADDLDTPAALAAVDAWAAEAVARRGPDREAPALVATAVDALLGVALRAGPTG